VRWTADAGGKQYKTWELYVCITLNRLVQDLDIDLYQPGLESKLDGVLAARGQKGLSKFEISCEIKSNHHMTNKIIAHMEGAGLVKVDADGRGYRIRVTREGVLHARKFNEFYMTMYHDFLVDHYRFRQLPVWFKK
jgi:predicted transcriptional regulator